MSDYRTIIVPILGLIWPAYLLYLQYKGSAFSDKKIIHILIISLIYLGISFGLMISYLLK